MIRAIPLDDICIQHHARDRARASRNQRSSDIIAVACLIWERMKHHDRRARDSATLLKHRSEYLRKIQFIMRDAPALPRADMSTPFASLFFACLNYDIIEEARSRCYMKDERRISAKSALTWSKAFITGYYVISRDSDLEASVDAFKLDKRVCIGGHRNKRFISFSERIAESSWSWKFLGDAFEWFRGTRIRYREDCDTANFGRFEERAITLFYTLSTFTRCLLEINTGRTSTFSIFPYREYFHILPVGEISVIHIEMTQRQNLARDHHVKCPSR